MKILIYSLIFCPGFINGATIRLAFDSVIEAFPIGDRFPLGTPFSISIDYEVPSFSNGNSSIEKSFSDVKSESMVTINSRNFVMDKLFVSAQLQSTGPDSRWRIGFASFSDFNEFGPPIVVFNSLSINYLSDDPLFDDPGRLPSSLSEWNLEEGEMELTFYFEGIDENMTFGKWSFTSTTISNLTLGPIPEPSSVLMLFAGSVGLSLRRKRVG